jgi:hypothetical protein
MLSELIDTTIPKYLSAKTKLPVSAFPSFTPHITIATGLDQHNPDPQGWLENLNLTAASDLVNVQFQRLETRAKWNMKLFFSVEKGEMLKKLGKSAGLSTEEIESWYPHASLV